MSFEIMRISPSLIQKQAVDEIEKCNGFSVRFGLTLSRLDAADLVETRALALKSCGRIEFGERREGAEKSAYLNDSVKRQDYKYLARFLT